MIYHTCVRCGLTDANVLDLDTGGAYHPELRGCISMLRDRLAAVETERDAIEGMYRHHVAVALDAIAKLNHAQAILAALREPSEAVVKAVKDAIYEELGIDYWDGKTRRILYYAVAAAEREVANGHV